VLVAFLPRALPVVLGAALRIQSELACPDPTQISRNLQEVVVLSQESAEALQATVRRDEHWLVLSLQASDGTALGERRLADEGDCETLARAAAVVFAAWLSNEHPEFLVGLPLDVQPPPSRVSTDSAQVPAQSETPSAPVGAPPREPEPKPSPTPSTANEYRFVLGLGLGASASASTFAPGVTLNAAWDPGRQGWGARLGVAWLGARSEPLAGHRVSWTRWPLFAGPFLRLGSKHTSFDLEVGAALGWARLSGRGFGADTTDSGLTFGGYTALRFVTSDAPLHTFLMAAPLLWFGDSTAVATDGSGATVSQTLPSFEVLIALGVELPL